MSLSDAEAEIAQARGIGDPALRAQAAGGLTSRLDVLASQAREIRDGAIRELRPNLSRAKVAEIAGVSVGTVRAVE